MKLAKIEALVNKILSIPVEEYDASNLAKVNELFLIWDVLDCNNNYFLLRTNVGVKGYHGEFISRWRTNYKIDQQQYNKLLERRKEIDEHVDNLRTDFIVIDLI